MVDGEPLIDSSFMTFDDSSDWKEEDKFFFPNKTC